MKSKVRSSLRRLRTHLTNESWSIYRRLVCKVCLDHRSTSWSREIEGLTRNQNVTKLVEYADSLVDRSYSTAEEHFSANQIASIIRKYPFPKELNQYDPERVGRESFDRMEQRCSSSNQKFLSGNIADNPERSHLLRASVFIHYALGIFDLRGVYDNCDFGPGASVGVHGNATNYARKIASNWSVSPGALLYARSACMRNDHLFELLTRNGEGTLSCRDPELAYANFRSRASLVAYNKIAFVPKTVKTYRSIAVEPLLNGFLQTGVDKIMRHKLLRIGIDLSDQTINARMAREGSLSDNDNSFVTIDLSSASDSISIGLCNLLLPPDWFDFLNSIRSKSYLRDGVVTRYHKFCSMGNGFCFPLETLLFTAACISVGCGKAGVDFHVYGDDIIVRKKHAEPLLRLLTEMGFEVNSKKTFLQGPFRESCGTDWFGGDDVRPFILDFTLDSFESIAKFLNLSRRNERATSFFSGVRDLLLDLLPPDLRIFRPLEGPPDTAITVERDLFMTSPYAKWSKDLWCWSWLELLHYPIPDAGWGNLRDSDLSLLMAGLRGSRSEAPFTVRRKTGTRMRRIAHA